MRAKTYMLLYTLFQGHTISFMLLGLVFFALTCLGICGLIGSWFSMDLKYLIVLAVFALMSILFLGAIVLPVMRIRKSCNYLEQRGLMEEATSQLREQPHRGSAYILTKDFYFDRFTGKVVCLKDVVQIELIESREWNEDRGREDKLELLLTTCQGETVNPSSTNPRIQAVLQQQFEILQERYPEKIIGTVPRE